MVTENNIPRLNHSLACGKMFYKLQGKKTSLELCCILGLFHDLAHSWSKDFLIDYVYKNNIKLLQNEEQDFMLLHAPIGAFFLKKEFPKLKQCYINALRYHTCPILGLGSVELNFYVADKIDYTRVHITDDFRNKVVDEKNPEIRTLMVLEMQCEYLKHKGKSFIPATQEFYNSLKLKYVGL